MYKIKSRKLSMLKLIILLVIMVGCSHTTDKPVYVSSGTILSYWDYDDTHKLNISYPINIQKYKEAPQYLNLSISLLKPLCNRWDIWTINLIDEKLINKKIIAQYAAHIESRKKYYVFFELPHDKCSIEINLHPKNNNVFNNSIKNEDLDLNCNDDLWEDMILSGDPLVLRVIDEE